MTVVAALAGPAVMGGLLFSPQAIAFKIEKLDPIKGLGRVFSTKGLIELVKALLKFFLISAVAILLFLSMEGEVMKLVSLNVKEAIVRSGEMIIWAVLLLSMTIVLIAAIDVPYQLWSHNKQLKMTKQEVKDESKETDGRPEVKARVRQLQREASQRRMLEDVPQADVVITNPTHYSVALKYDAEGASAPIVVAKGADLIALKIRSIASSMRCLFILNRLLHGLFLAPQKLVMRYRLPCFSPWQECLHTFSSLLARVPQITCHARMRFHFLTGLISLIMRVP